MALRNALGIFSHMTSSETSAANNNDPGENAEAEADFGYRRVQAGDKAGLVRGVFDSVASATT